MSANEARKHGMARMAGCGRATPPWAAGRVSWKAVHFLHSFSAAELALMKPTATLVNIARGGIVDDAALIDALNAGKIAAAGLDVFENEPAFNPAFLGLSNVVLTPHIGSASGPTRRAMADCAAVNLIAALSGQRPPNLLNTESFL